MRTLRFLLLVAAIGMAALFRVVAHEPGLSTMQVRVLKDGLDVTLVFSAKEARELARKTEGAVPGDVIAEVILAERAGSATRFVVDGEPVKAEAATCDFDNDSNATLRFHVKARARKTLEIQSRWLDALPAGHRQFVSVEAEPLTVLAERLLSATSDSVIVEMAPGGAESTETKTIGTWPDFVGLGLKHILVGFDHLLFLFSLVIVSYRLLPTVQLVTAFTVAHSITLALATLNVLTISSQIVEPLIAATIVFVGVENLVRRDIGRSRILLVFIFGLIHGLGFASVLRDLGVGSVSSGIIVPLLSFNLGVELGQLLVVFLIAPLIYWAGRVPSWKHRLVPVCSVMVTGAGLFWLIERLFGSI
ncbi:MAG: HupE/UreJ family protein [Verrucomicrobia bacterium]|nr:HupE/UreJ family protein [Verrucomicrobiota bacterium]